MTTPIILHVDGELPKATTLEAFLEANAEGLSAEELESVRGMRDGGVLCYVAGGGAVPRWAIDMAEPIGHVCSACLRDACREAISSLGMFLPDLTTRNDLVNNAFAPLAAEPEEGAERRPEILLALAYEHRSTVERLEGDTKIELLPADLGPQIVPMAACYARMVLMMCTHRDEPTRRFPTSKPPTRHARTVGDPSDLEAASKAPFASAIPADGSKVDLSGMLRELKHNARVRALVDNHLDDLDGETKPTDGD